MTLLQIPSRSAPSYEAVCARFAGRVIAGFMDVAEYEAFNKTALTKHEYWKGWAVQVPGGTPEHNIIIPRLTTLLTIVLDDLETDCTVFGSDQKIFINESRIVYPDIAVVIGDWQVDHYDRLRNPYLVVEVLSESTEDEDRGPKFEEYKSIDSLQHYVLVEQYEIGVTHFARNEQNQWHEVATYRDLSDTLTIPVGEQTATVPLFRIYRKIFA